MQPCVSRIKPTTIRARGNELMQCIRLDGANSTTTDDSPLDRIRALFAGVVAQVGTGFSVHLHKVSKAVDTRLPPIPDYGLAATVDARSQAHLAGGGLRDKTLTLTVPKRPERAFRPRALASGPRMSPTPGPCVERRSIRVSGLWVRRSARSLP